MRVKVVEGTQVVVGGKVFDNCEMLDVVDDSLARHFVASGWAIEVKQPSGRKAASPPPPKR